MTGNVELHSWRVLPVVCASWHAIVKITNLNYSKQHKYEQFKEMASIWRPFGNSPWSMSCSSMLSAPSLEYRLVVLMLLSCRINPGREVRDKLRGGIWGDWNNSGNAATVLLMMYD